MTMENALGDRAAVPLHWCVTCRLASTDEKEGPTDDPFTFRCVLRAGRACSGHAPGPGTGAGETLTNDGVVKLVQLGFGDDIVIAKIKPSPQVSFSLDTDGLVELREAHVSPQVIAAMLDRATPKAPPAALLAGFPSASALGMDAIDVRLLTPSRRGASCTLERRTWFDNCHGVWRCFHELPRPPLQSSDSQPDEPFPPLGGSAREASLHRKSGFR